MRRICKGKRKVGESSPKLKRIYNVGIRESDDQGENIKNKAFLEEQGEEEGSLTSRKYELSYKRKWMFNHEGLKKLEVKRKSISKKLKSIKREPKQLSINSQNYEFLEELKKMQQK